MVRTFFYSMITTTICFSAISYAEEEKDLKGPSSMRVGVRHIEKGGVGYNNGYTTLQMFLAAPYSSWAVIPFIDLRGHVFDDGKFAANAGLGVRGLAGCRAYGINAYYDYRNTKHDHYNQIALGLESLGVRWDFRINGYLPVGDKISSRYGEKTSSTDKTFDSFSGNNVLVRHSQTTSWKKQYAMKGMDAETAFHFLKNKNFDLYAAVGPYCYNYKNKQAIGGQVRAGTKIYEYLSLELINSYDSRFHENFQGQVGVSIPLGGKQKITKNMKLTNCNDSYFLSQRLIQDVKRQEIVVVDRLRQSQMTDFLSTAINPETGSPYFFVFVDNTSNSLGTFSSPYPTLALAGENSSPGDIIYVLPGDGTTTGMDAGIVLKADQKLWGSISAYTLAISEGSFTIPQMSSTRPKITNLATLGTGVTLATNNEVKGLTITNASGSAISGIDPELLILSNCLITECGQYGAGINPVALQINSPFEGVFDGNTFSNNFNGGIYIILDTGASATKLTVINNSAANNEATTGGSAIINIDPIVEIGSCDITIAGNSFIDNPNLRAVNISSIIGSGNGAFSTFSGNFVANTFTDNRDGIFYGVNGESCTISVTNNNLSNNLEGSLQVISGNQRIGEVLLTLQENQMNGSNSSAVNISPVCDRFTSLITNNSIQDNGATGILYFNQTVPLPELNFTISNNTIANNRNIESNAAGGIAIDGFRSLNISIIENDLNNNTQGNSIGIYGPYVPLPTEDAIVTFKDNQLTNGDTLNFQFWGDSPNAGCLSITGNQSAESTAYYFFQGGSIGSCQIAPISYETDNTGGFSLSDGITPVSSCSEGGL